MAVSLPRNCDTRASITGLKRRETGALAIADTGDSELKIAAVIAFFPCVPV